MPAVYVVLVSSLWHDPIERECFALARMAEKSGSLQHPILDKAPCEL